MANDKTKSSTAYFYLVVLRGDSKGKRYPVEEGDNVIGRWDPDAGAFPEIDLDSEDTEAKISRKHAIVQRKGDVLLLGDLGSLNGTFLNRGPRLKEGERLQIRDGDEIVIGKTFLTVEVEIKPAESLAKED